MAHFKAQVVRMNLYQDQFARDQSKGIVTLNYAPESIWEKEEKHSVLRRVLASRP